MLRGRVEGGTGGTGVQGLAGVGGGDAGSDSGWGGGLGIRICPSHTFGPRHFGLFRCPTPWDRGT